MLLAMAVMVGGGAVLSPMSESGGGGRVVGNRMSTWAMRFQNVEYGGKANVQSSIETTKVEHGVMAGNRLSTWAL